MSREENLEMIRNLNDEINALETLKSKVPLSKNLSSEVILADKIQQKLQNTNEREAEGLLALARRRQKKRENYINLASILLFFSLYSIMLLLQRNQLDAFNVESR